MTAVETNPPGKIQIQAVERDGRRMGGVGVRRS
jgi:hypothetical protein